VSAVCGGWVGEWVPNRVTAGWVGAQEESGVVGLVDEASCSISPDCTDVVLGAHVHTPF
jgi:hypothetical protein